MNHYIPAPLPTEHIKLSAELQEAVRQLSRNTHEIWSAQRLRDGWIYGRERDDAKKYHPCLVPYEELDETERSYDQEIVEQVIKGLMILGFEITGACTKEWKGEDKK